jgi:nucleoid-associated protein YgaU
MKTGLLTIFAVAISAALTAGSPHASEPSTLNADAAETADSPADAEPVPAAAAPAPEPTVEVQVVTDVAESVETADASETADIAETTETAEIAETVDSTEAPQTEEVAESDVTAAADSAVAANDDTAIDPEIPGATDEIDNAETPAETDADPTSQLAGSDAEPARKTSLGKIGYDEQGRSGRIHVVVQGDTLWDISDAYLGTPWVWPSVWTDNRDIENPHLIVPDDRIWISAHEMRRVTAEEAERLLAGQPLAAGADAEFAGPASDSFQSLFQDEDGPNVVRVSSLESSGLISAEQLEAAASIVDAANERILLSQGDRVYIGLGDQQASVGDQFTIFRTEEKIYDPDTNRLLGYHVDMLGWVEVEETDAEASLAVIRMSAGEMELGDRVTPREQPVLDVEVAASPKNVDGQISFFPSSRVLMGSADYVYLNRGELDGLQVGSPLEVYRTGWRAPEPARGTRVDVPDRVIADLLVVRARRESSVALIRHTETELELGDHFRGAAE